MHGDQAFDDFQWILPLLLICIVECIVIDLLWQAIQDNSILVSSQHLDREDRTIHLILDEYDLLIKLWLCWLHNIRWHRVLFVLLVDHFQCLFIHLRIVWYGIARDYLFIELLPAYDLPRSVVLLDSYLGEAP